MGAVQSAAMLMMQRESRAQRIALASFESEVIQWRNWWLSRLVLGRLNLSYKDERSSISFEVAKGESRSIVVELKVFSGVICY